jgi:glutamate 5-kinase
MIDPVRQEVITQAHTVVVKVGTNVLTTDSGLLDPIRLQSLADQIQRIRQTGRKVVLVSSGAIGAGMGRLGLPQRPTDLRYLQACAAVGQGFLMRAYQECLDKHNTHTAQILLTAGDFDNRARYLNVRNTILTLFEWNVVPIINENDTVSVAEIRFGDNDHLAAMVTNLLQAPLLILLTNVDGLYATDPRTDPAARKIDTVPLIDGSILEMAGGSKSSLGTGGMRSKIRAARLATTAGESVIMANGGYVQTGRQGEGETGRQGDGETGRQGDGGTAVSLSPCLPLSLSNFGVLDVIFSGEPVGTIFLPHGSSIPAWKRWLGFTAQPRGKLVVDAGARRAVQEKGRSLLPIGVMQVQGSFNKGDVVALYDADSVEFARGLTNYSAADINRILGLHSQQVIEVLGVLPYEEIVHRDNLVVVIG